MYQKLNSVSGAASVNSALGQFPVTPNAAGATLDTSALYSNAPDSAGASPLPVTAAMPARLYDWLMDLRLLRHIPLSYLVPDSALLPEESIRFFHVDPTWVDRIIDGVFSAANMGTVDSIYSAAMIQLIRATLDAGLAAMAGTNWDASHGVTGMLIRSDLVRRWPDVIVRAYTGADENSAPVGVLRAEPISSGIYIALFAGTPGMVELREPHVGVRFGLETNDDAHYFYEYRNPNPAPAPAPAAPVTVAGAAQLSSPASKLAVNPAVLGQVAGGLTYQYPPGTKAVTLSAKRTVPVGPIGSAARTVAIELMRPTFVQQFTSLKQTGWSAAVPESRGSMVLFTGPVDMTKLPQAPLAPTTVRDLARRFNQQQNMGGN
jgi:hypothetical protein